MALVIAPALILGIIIGAIELFFVHADQHFRGSHWLSHGLHAAIFAIVFVFINMNVSYVLSVLGLTQLWMAYVIYLIVAVAAFVKIGGAAAGSGKVVREKMWHVLVIVILISLSGIIWDLAAPVCKSLINPVFC